MTGCSTYRGKREREREWLVKPSRYNTATEELPVLTFHARQGAAELAEEWLELYSSNFLIIKREVPPYITYI